MLFLRYSAKWMFFAALAYAPWAYGGTTSTSINVINCLLGTAVLLWVIELLVNKRRPKFPKVLIFLIVTLLAIGGCMVVNAYAIYDADFGLFAPLQNIASRAPGSVDYAISAAWMIRGGLLLFTILFVVDLSQDSDGLVHLCYAIGIVAGSISLIGLLQKATGAEMIFWQPTREQSKEIYPFFATYYYHANAGAFLNLVLPLTAGLAVRGFATRSRPFLRATWLSIFVLDLAAVAANTSRMAQLIGALLFIGLSIQLGPAVARRLSWSERNIALVGAAVIFLALFSIGRASHLEQPLQHWQMLAEQTPGDARWLAARVAISALPNIGFFGFGPGTFRIVFPVANSMASQPALGQWRFLHEDYLQTAIEWGWVGSALWGILFFGAIGVAVRSVYRQRALRRRAAGQAEKLKTETLKSNHISASQRFRVSDLRYDWTPRRRLILPLAAIALGGVALHALVDFPLQIASIQLYAATYVGICWGSALWESASQ